MECLTGSVGGANAARAGQASYSRPRKNPLGPRSGDLLVGVVMESEWDALRVLGAVTALFLLLWATWAVGSTVYVYLLPQVRRSNHWLRAHGAWAGKKGGLCAKQVEAGQQEHGQMTGEGPQSGQTPGTPGSITGEGWICMKSSNLSEVSEPLADERGGRKPGGLGLSEGGFQTRCKKGQEGHGVDDGGRIGWGSPPALSSSPF